MGILRWQTHLNPVLSAGLILGLGVWLIILYRRQRRQYSAKEAAVLVVPKILIVLLALLFFASWMLERLINFATTTVEQIPNFIR